MAAVVFAFNAVVTERPASVIWPVRVVAAICQQHTYFFRRVPVDRTQHAPAQDAVVIGRGEKESAHRVLFA